MEQTTHDTALKEGVIYNNLSCTWVHVTIFHDVHGVVDGHIDTSHHALVITEEEDG